MKRATVNEIRQYDWFQINLPEYLFPDDGNMSSDVVNEEALAEVYIFMSIYCYNKRLCKIELKRKIFFQINVKNKHDK